MTSGIKKAGGISFGVSMATSKLASDVKRARTLMGGFVSSTKSMLGGVQGQLAGLIGIGGLGALARQSFNTIDALHDTAKSLSVSTEALSGLGHAAEQSGSSQQTLESGLARMTKTTRDASLGMETAARAYSKLGLNAEALNKLSPDKQFMAIADAVKGLGNAQDQLTVTQDIFGRGASELVETLRLGTDGLGAMRDEAEKLGIAINTLDAAKIAKAADQMDRTKKILTGISNDMVIQFGPMVTQALADQATGISRMTGGEGGETRAEAALRIKTESAAERHRSLLLQAQARHRQKQKTPGTSQFNAAAIDKLGIKLKDFGMGAAKGLMATPGQIMQGIMGGQIPQAQRSLFMAQMKQMLFVPEKKKEEEEKKEKRKFSPASFGANESGSLAAYQQRVRGMQQMSKVPEKQLTELEKIRKAMEKNPVGMVAEGAVP